jgi:hypothetical protein
MDRDTQKAINELLKDKESEKKAEQLYVLREAIRGIIETNNLHFVSENNEFAIWNEDKICYNSECGLIYKDTFRWSFHTKPALQGLFNDIQGEYPWKVFMDTLAEYPDRKKLGRASGISVSQKDLNLLYLKPIATVVGEPHWIFDTLISSICGGKAENIDHIEKCIIHKRREPGCIFIPWIVLNDGGGTGKDLFTATVLSNLLGPWCCLANLPLEKFIGKFGDILEGKCIALINEKPEDNESLGKLKAMNGSRTNTIEPKGKRSYEADAILWGILASNNTMGTVTLATNDSDRRYSIISGEEPLKYHVAKKLDELDIIENCNQEQAKEWIETIGQYILFDKQEFGKWMNYIIEKHGKDVRVLSALHGEDYKKLLSIQESTQVSVWEKIFDKDFEYIRRKLIWQFYLYCIEEDHAKTHLGKKRFYAEMDIWLKQNRPDIKTHLNVNWNKMDTNSLSDSLIESCNLKTKTDICGAGFIAKRTYKVNDFKYCFFDESNNEYKWKIELN